MKFHTIVTVTPKSDKTANPFGDDATVYQFVTDDPLTLELATHFLRAKGAPLRNRTVTVNGVPPPQEVAVHAQSAVLCNRDTGTLYLARYVNGVVDFVTPVDWVWAGSTPLRDILKQILADYEGGVANQMYSDLDPDVLETVALYDEDQGLRDMRRNTGVQEMWSMESRRSAPC